MDVAQLSVEVRVSPSTVSQFEIVAEFKGAAEAAGVEFTPEDGQGPGVKLRKAK
jgi:hypothetical protein